MDERMARQMQRFYALRKRVLDAIASMLEDGSGEHHKSYEGAMELRLEWPEFFVPNPYTAEPEATVVLHCYLLGPGRHFEWHDTTLQAALDRAERDIEEWMQWYDEGGED